MFWEIIKNVGQKQFLWQGLRYVFSEKKWKRSADLFGECYRCNTQWSKNKSVFYNLIMALKFWNKTVCNSFVKMDLSCFGQYQLLCFCLRKWQLSQKAVSL